MVEIFVTLVRKRDNGLRWILYLMFVAFGIYWFVVEEHALIYFYLLDTIPDFTGTEYAIFGVYSDLLGMVALLVGMPLIGELPKFLLRVNQAYLHNPGNPDQSHHSHRPDPLTDKLYVAPKLESAEFEALQLQNVWSG